MKFKDSLQGNLVVFEISGKVVAYDDSVTRFHGRVREYINLNKSSVVVDLGKIEMMSSVGLGMLISGLTAVRNSGGRMVLANITRIQNLIAVTRLNTVFESYDSVEEAIKSFKAD